MLEINFLKSVYNLSELPTKILPEAILCGRSNVGKSSFINSLFSTKIAMTSSTPGKTRSINYYIVNNKFYIVDLPGFGYAKVSKKEKIHWKNLLQQFFSLKRNQRIAIHLIDSRHAPLQNDLILNSYLKNFDIPYLVVLNKIDKLSQSEIEKSMSVIRKYFPELIFKENLFAYSSVTKYGKKEIISRLKALFL
ncbi:ribosome biogenesis GTP-binding protein YihA/YsxC [Melioribacteraceae bacterium 4301-Me]|uniref:ribosome biogenesis GTP-binding protein YihA/YsxC n=1 Tax=Pyranulibacter aquaticus TaxID=3163344 RepID=UPI00359AA187